MPRGLTAKLRKLEANKAAREAAARNNSSAAHGSSSSSTAASSLYPLSRPGSIFSSALRIGLEATAAAASAGSTTSRAAVSSTTTAKPSADKPDAATSGAASAEVQSAGRRSSNGHRSRSTTGAGSLTSPVATADIASRPSASSQTQRTLAKTTRRRAFALADHVHSKATQCNHESISPVQMSKVSSLIGKLFSSCFVHALTSMYDAHLGKIRRSVLGVIFLDLLEDDGVFLDVNQKPSTEELRKLIGEECDSCLVDFAAVSATEEVVVMLAEVAEHHGDECEAIGGPCACSFTKCICCLESLVDSIKKCSCVPSRRSTPSSRKDPLPAKDVLKDIESYTTMEEFAPAGTFELFTEIVVLLQAELERFQPSESKKAREVYKMLTLTDPLETYYQALTREICCDPPDTAKCQGPRGSKVDAHDDEAEGDDDQGDDAEEDDDDDDNEQKEDDAVEPKDDSEADSEADDGDDDEHCGSSILHSCGHRVPLPASVVRDGELHLSARYQAAKKLLKDEFKEYKGKGRADDQGPPSGRGRAASSARHDVTGARFRKVAARAIHDHGLSFLNVGKSYRVSELLRHAQALDCKEFAYPCNRAGALIHTQAFGSAIAACDTAISLNPNDELAFFRRAVCKVAGSDDREAEEDFETFFSLAARNQTLQKLSSVSSQPFVPSNVVDELCEWASHVKTPATGAATDDKPSALSGLSATEAASGEEQKPCWTCWDKTLLQPYAARMSTIVEKLMSQGKFDAMFPDKLQERLQEIQNSLALLGSDDDSGSASVPGSPTALTGPSDAVSSVLPETVALRQAAAEDMDMLMVIAFLKVMICERNPAATNQVSCKTLKAFIVRANNCKSACLSGAPVYNPEFKVHLQGLDGSWPPRPAWLDERSADQDSSSSGDDSCATVTPITDKEQRLRLIESSRLELMADSAIASSSKLMLNGSTSLVSAPVDEQVGSAKTKAKTTTKAKKRVSAKAQGKQRQVDSEANGSNDGGKASDGVAVGVASKSKGTGTGTSSRDAAAKSSKPTSTNASLPKPAVQAAIQQRAKTEQPALDVQGSADSLSSISPTPAAPAAEVSPAVSKSASSNATRNGAQQTPIAQPPAIDGNAPIEYRYKATKHASKKIKKSRLKKAA